ncbi:Uncharacterised protein [Serratia fonticola]|uniref:Uncharacterized protein n=1 Tax=Serratia fonticola TaxID=47917 RepID=A0A4U9TAE0_SERFO|nr:Uncharacterised protein [Serratia fonticola]
MSFKTFSSFLPGFLGDQGSDSFTDADNFPGLKRHIGSLTTDTTALAELNSGITSLT